MGPSSLATEAHKNAFKGLLPRILKNFYGTPMGPLDTSSPSLYTPSMTLSSFVLLIVSFANLALLISTARNSNDS